MLKENSRKRQFSIVNFFNGIRCYSALFIGLIGAATYLAISSVNLTAQGLYYDELCQVPASFAYKKIIPQMFSALSFRGIPLLNMNYIGAIKSGFYGLYLKFSDSCFSIVSWRLLGILFVSMGIFFFCILTKRRLSLKGLFLFLLLFMTDTTIILATRHDWGPVALALMFRMLFISLWIYGEQENKPPSTSNTFFLGVLVGISAYEKLSSTVLILPLLLIFVLSKNRSSFRHCFVCLAGVFIGTIPLIAANLISFHRRNCLISFIFPRLTDTIPYDQTSFLGFMGFMKFALKYLSLGDGVSLKAWILSTNTANNHLEAYLMGVIFLLIMILSGVYGKRNKFFRMSLLMLLCYGIIGIGLYLLPMTSWVHHWIIGTPFQYMAISLAFVGLYVSQPTINLSMKLWRISFSFLVITLLVFRLLGLVSLEKSFIKGATSLGWDSSFTKIGYFAAEHSEEVVFVAANWGVAAQIYCLSNGKPNLVYEPFWQYGGSEQLRRIIKESGKNTLYLVINKTVNLKHDVALRIIRDIETLPNWKEVPVENSIKESEAIKTRKFSYISVR